MLSQGRNPHLCEECSSIFDMSGSDHVVTHVWRPWKPTFQAIQASADMGCRLCAEVLGEWQPDMHNVDQGPSISAEVNPFQYMFWDMWSAKTRSPKPTVSFLDEYKLAFRTTGKRNSFDITDFTFHYLHAVDGSSESIVAPTKSKIDGFDMYKRLDRAKEWLHNCTNHHSTCVSDWANTPRTPTRLIRLRQEGIHTKARLVEQTEIPGTPQYVTLSYRWDEEPALQLRQATMPIFKKEIPLVRLRPLFRDIFSMVISLGCKYVWIDALCIVQDSPNDWANEAEMMASVYQFAYCNIAVTTPKDGIPKVFDPVTSVTPSLLEVYATLSFGDLHLTSTFQLIPNTFWQSRIDKSELSHRAWVLQERFFSPRIIFLTRDQLLWECLNLNACESFPNGIPEFCYRVPIIHYHQIVDLGRRNDRPSILQAWETMRSAYSGSALTFPTDKLFAIAGIIKGFADVLQDKSIAGLWRKNFLTELLWVRTSSKGSPRPDDRRAPSWSWACLDAQINSFFSFLPSNEVIASVQSIDIQSRDLAISGQVKLRAPLTKGILGTQHRAVVTFDADPADLEGLTTEMRDSTQAAGAPSVSLYLLTINSPPTSTGLVLRRADEQGHYSRIGLFYLSLDESPEILDPREILDEEIGLSEDDYLEDHGGGTYTVVLV